MTQKKSNNRSQVEHGILQGISVNTSSPQLLRFRHDVLRAVRPLRQCALRPESLKELVKIAPSSLARKISVVSRRSEADGLGCTSEHVANGVGEHLECIGLEIVLVVDDIIVSGSCCSLKTAVRC